MTTKTPNPIAASAPETPQDDAEPPEAPDATASPAGGEINAQDAADDTDAPDADDADDAPDDLRSARNEAANRRKELRSTQAVLAEAQAKIEALERQTAEAERERQTHLVENRIQAEPDNNSGRRMHNPADFFALSGIDPADLIGDDGKVSERAYTDAVDALRTERPYLFAESWGVKYDRDHAGRTTSAAQKAAETRGAWQKALSPTGR